MDSDDDLPPPLEDMSEHIQKKQLIKAGADEDV
jgi:hypothetical protein